MCCVLCCGGHTVLVMVLPPLLESRLESAVSVSQLLLVAADNIVAPALAAAEGEYR